MSNEPNKKQPTEQVLKTSKSDPVVRERVQELTWALVDEQILDDEVRLLENLLLSDDDARSTYVNCVQLHTDLMHHFGKRTAKAGSPAKGSPVLSFLNTASPGSSAGEVKQ